MQVKVYQKSTGHYLPVRVNGQKKQTVNPATKDWPKHDPNPANCSGKGHARCVEQGEHSWFNHSQDNMSSIGNLPEHVKQSPNLYAEVS